MLRAVLCALSLCAATGVAAQSISVEELAPAPVAPLVPENRERVERVEAETGNLVSLRGLDKVTARTRDFEIAIGESVEFGALTISAQYCRKRPPEETPETYAFLQILDRRTDGFGVDTEGEQIFSGWMFASRPAQNPLEHPVYDVWVIDCRA